MKRKNEIAPKVSLDQKRVEYLRRKIERNKALGKTAQHALKNSEPSNRKNGTYSNKA